MTLRLTEEQERALAALAEAEGVSKREAAARAITEKAARVSREADIRSHARESIGKYTPLLDRLAQ